MKPQFWNVAASLPIVVLMAACSESPVDVSAPQDVGVPELAATFMLETSNIAIDESGFLLSVSADHQQVIRRAPTGEALDVWVPHATDGSPLSILAVEPVRVESIRLGWSLGSDPARGKVLVLAYSPRPTRLVLFDAEMAVENEWPERRDSNTWPGRTDMMAVGAEGHVYTLRHHEGTVVQYSPEGVFEREWAARGPSPTQPDRPSGIAVGPHGVVYISDTLNHRVLMFTRDGKLLGEFGGRGSSLGEFGWPEGLAIDQRRILYVADVLNARVQMFTLDGKPIGVFGTGRLPTASEPQQTPSQVRAGSDGVYVLHSDGLVNYFAFPAH